MNHEIILIDIRQFIPSAAMIKHAKSFNLRRQRLWLLPQKAVYWQKKKMLLVADLHIGKSGHFRKNGIPVPPQVNSNNFEILDHLLDDIKVNHIIFLGDLFHSHVNEEWHQLKYWRKQYPQTEITLVIGNHDILPRSLYHASHISVFKKLKISPFQFVHDLQTVKKEVNSTDHYLLGGHVHPALQLKGRGRQHMKFPCFYFGKEAGILPAFGEFTGTAIIQPEEGDQTFVIVKNQVVAMTNS